MTIIKGKNKLQTQEEKKKEMGEDLEYLRQVDRGEKEGRQFIADYETDKNKKEQKVKDDIASFLQEQHDREFTYRNQLAKYGTEILIQAQLPNGFIFWFVPTDGTDIQIGGKVFKTQKGIILILESPNRELYTRAFFTTMDPIYDMKAVETLCIQAENTIDSIRGLLLSDNKDTQATLKKTPGGIILPN